MFSRSCVVLLVVAGSASLALYVGQAQAVITEPIPDDAPAGPPPIPSLPVASDTPPPADVIGDPLDPTAGCSGWYLQSSYAAIWPAGSTWWEYECSLAEVQYPPCPDLPGVMCSLGYTILYPPWTDRFYWDGSQPAFLGENSQVDCEHWWDAPTARWYALVEPGCPTEVSPPPPPPPPPPNIAPTAGFNVSCTGLGCALDGRGSADADGTIVQYAWELGDGATVAGRTAGHTYPQTGSYSVRLIVTDDDGATGTASRTVVPITGLTARGYKQKGVQKVDLSWTGSGGASYDVLRDGTRIATVVGASYSDSFDRRSSGTYRYQVCAADSQICSSQAAVNF
jgi:PKD domain-containing protein